MMFEITFCLHWGKVMASGYESIKAEVVKVRPGLTLPTLGVFGPFMWRFHPCSLVGVMLLSRDSREARANNIIALKKGM